MEFSYVNEEKTQCYYKNYLFYIRFQNKDSVLWRCAKKDCAASITSQDDMVIREPKTEHNHPPASDDEIRIKSAIRQLKNRAAKELSMPLSRMYREATIQLRNDNLNPSAIAEFWPHFDRIRSTLRSIRRRIYNSLLMPPNASNDVLEMDDSDADVDTSTTRINTTSPPPPSAPTSTSARNGTCNSKREFAEIDQDTTDNSVCFSSNMANEAQYRPVKRDRITGPFSDYEYSALSDTTNRFWLSAFHVKIALDFISRQYPHIIGLSNVNMGQHEVKYTSDDFENCQAVFLLQARNHWLVLTNINPNCATEPGSPVVWLLYDSTNNPDYLRDLMPSFRHLIGNDDDDDGHLNQQQFIVDTVKVHRQYGVDDDGMFALAYVMSICNGKNPARLVYEQVSMRDNYYRFLDDGCFMEFNSVEIPTLVPEYTRHYLDLSTFMRSTH